MEKPKEIKKQEIAPAQNIFKKEEKKSVLSAAEDDDFWKVVEEDHSAHMGKDAKKIGKDGKMEQTLDLWINHPEKKKPEVPKKQEIKKLPLKKAEKIEQAKGKGALTSKRK